MDDLDRFRAAVRTDAALQADLAAFDDAAAFAAHARERAQALGIALTAEALAGALRDDPAGLTRWTLAPPTPELPLPGWLPTAIVPTAQGICIDWAFFGDRGLREPFFEDTTRQVLRRPLNRLTRYRTPLGALPQIVQRLPVREPSGFIFHMSRCGSTLAGQMLAADPGTAVISEAGAIDMLLMLDNPLAPASGEAQAKLLRALILALGHGSRAAVFKFHSWHALALPLFRRLFPTTPWLFLYRDPAEVLASQLRDDGMQAIPVGLFFPPDQGAPSAAEDRCLTILRRTCEAVVAPFAQGGGLLLNYDQLPGAVASRVLPHFGIASAADMDAAARRDAKSPAKVFEADSLAKRGRLTAAQHEAVQRETGAIYARLEALAAAAAR
jgi:hypothetical protein